MKSIYHFKFEDLIIYNKAIDFGESVHDQVQAFPKEEANRLASQFTIAADAIALHIAEGSASSNDQFNNYLQIAWDRAHECIVCSTKARLRGFITEEQDELNRGDITELTKMITSFKRHLKLKQLESSSK
ncbi:four helix bundle protein [Aquimarina sp. 433]